MPLITQDMTDLCLSVCLQLCFVGNQNCMAVMKTYGGAELFLSLWSTSRFQGHERLITVLLRRMLNDETTLQTAMETEIHSTVVKLEKKQTFGPQSYWTKIEVQLFFQAVTPLKCHYLLVFLKAAPASGVAGTQFCCTMCSITQYQCFYLSLCRYGESHV